MSEDLNLPASLERLEINPERVDCNQMDQNRNIVPSITVEDECTLQSLSLEAECPKGNCNCNRKKDKEVTVKRVTLKRVIVRRSKLKPLVLRSPVLKLRNDHPPAPPTCSSAAPPLPQPNSVSAALLPPPLPLPLPTSDACPSSSQSLVINNPGVGDESRLCGESEKVNAGSGTSSSVPVASSCAVEARSSPDDTTIDELASYFDLFVHIPKKMSFMAEMMYT